LQRCSSAQVCLHLSVAYGAPFSTKCQTVHNKSYCCLLRDPNKQAACALAVHSGQLCLPHLNINVCLHSAAHRGTSVQYGYEPLGSAGSLIISYLGFPRHQSVCLRSAAHRENMLLFAANNTRYSCGPLDSSQNRGLRTAIT
jgi:hypothetical protein